MRGRLLLVAIGAAFGSDERFAGRVAELRSFVAAEGHGDVPMGEPLGKWVASVRRAARGGKLDPEKRRTYAEAGGTFAPLEGRWDAAVDLLRGFVKREGHAAVPRNHTEGGVFLAAWLRARRSAAAGTLEPARAAALEALGVALRRKEDLREQNFDKYLAALAAYAAEARVKDAPRDATHDGLDVGRWLAGQRAKHAAGSLDAGRRAKLEAAGFSPSPARATKPSVSGAARSAWFWTQVEDQPTTLGQWYDTCVGHGAKFPFRPRQSQVSWRDDQVYHIMCILERKLALGESKFSALQIGANDGKDAFYDALVYARRHYGDVDVRATLVEPTLHNFDKLKAHYGVSETVGQIVEYVNGAVCDSCCAPDGTTQIFHPRWSLLEEWEQKARENPDKHPKAFQTPDGSWRQRWLYELNSLDRNNLKTHFKNDGDVESTTISCLPASRLGDDHDYVMIDVEGFDFEVLASLDLAKQRPLVINFESKIMEAQRPDALWRAATFCNDAGYHVVRGRANYICVRGDAPDVALRDVVAKTLA
ncbi:hypothetical protein JL721_6136 [Aureococcus anophagefferens]|nr:hypothetical protein JL721_6136 [Aureococcus anophagefferens]